MRLRLDPFSPHGVSVDNSTVTVAGGSTTTGSSVTVAGEDYLTLAAQEITANPIDLDNLSATGTPDSSTFLRGDNTWATPAGSGDVSKVGTPVNNQVGVWTGDGTIEGDADLTFDTTTDTLSTVNIAPSGTVDGRDIATDGTKLDGIATGATANTKATGAEVDTGTDDVKFLTPKAIEDSAYIKAAYADAKVADAINDGTTTIAPSQNAVFDALALKELLANKATDFSTVNDTLYPTVEAVQEAIASAVAGLLDYRGAYDASTNLFPATGGSGLIGAILSGDFWIASVGGTLGGTAVTVGDLIIATVDTPGQTASNWDIISNEIGYVPENVANKDTDGTLAANSDTKYASQKATKTYADTKQPLDADLTTIAGLTATTDNFMVATASAWASRTPTQARTQLGLGTLATQSGTFSGTSSGTNTGDQTSIVGITGTTAQFNTANTDADFYTTAGTDVAVTDGGTGRSTGTTAYSLVATGTTATGAQQTLANGATTEILVGGGASALPVWTTATGSGAPVRATSPTLVTPALGTPSALVLTNATGLPPAGRTGGFALGTLSSASTGNLAVTGVGFTPKLVRFTILPAANATLTTTAHGAMTSSAQFYTTSGGARNSSTSACIGLVSAGSSTPTVLATYVSMDADGFTINFSTAQAQTWSWEAYG